MKILAKSETRSNVSNATGKAWDALVAYLLETIDDLSKLLEYGNILCGIR